MKWTKNETEKLVKMYSEGKSNSEIAKVLKKSTAAIRRKISRINGPDQVIMFTNTEEVEKEEETETTKTCLPKNKVHSSRAYQGWNSSDLKTLNMMKKSNYSWMDIGSCLKRSPNECEIIFNSLDWDKFTATGAIESVIEKPVQIKRDDTITEKEFHSDVSMERVRLEQNNQKMMYQKQVNEKARWEMLIDMVKQGIAVAPRVEPELAPPADPNKLYDDEDMGLIISDTHIGESFTLADTNGLSEYNMSLFKKRAEVLKRRVESIANRHQRLHNLDTLNIFCLGDIVQGLKHVGKWGPAYNEQNVVNQVFEGVSEFSKLLIYWLGIFKNINFFGVMGNHGRGAPPNMEELIVNWDYMFYKILELQLGKYPEIKFDIPPSWIQKANVRGSKFILSHGEDAKSQLGLPFYGLVRNERRQIGLAGEIFDYMLCGHFHTSAELETNTGKIIINGSWVGGDVHSLKHMQTSSRPTQRAFGIHDKRGITWQYNIDLRSDDDFMYEGRHRPK